MTEDRQEQLESAMKKVKVANGFRLTTLFVAVVLLLFLYFAPKFFENASWFMNTKVIVFRILEWDVIFLVLVTIVKTYFSVKYNRIIKAFK